MTAPETTPEISMRDRDLVFGLILVLCSAALLWYAFNLSFDVMRTIDVTFIIAPGFSIIIVSGILFVLGLALIVIAFRQGGCASWLVPGRFIGRLKNQQARHTVLIFFYLFLYMCVFWEKIPGLHIPVPFWLSTGLFLLAMMWTFRAATLKVVVLTSIIVTVIVVVCFQFLAQIPFP